ncbi:metallophosphoesterase family protein [Arachidicoccus terrestris]|uniref:hypothetical protein n=1 Tax=Arachidicoccus terrestris TaxID=2875539 RepID=UPI001CC4A7B6|nr:hypothetical protein [Arachidicoccus terrestris]UAY55850.1 hypothetical protein K9M52_02095 [Arachidicoccus terrestris]
MRVITLGDLHGQHRKIKVPECDLLCCVGDYGAGRTSVVHLAKVPSDVHILLTHGPAYGYMDLIPQEYAQPGEDLHKGCKKTLEVIHKRLKKLKLFAFGHIHNAEMPSRSGSDNYGVRMVKVTNTRSVLFSNAACVDNSYNIVNPMPLIIDL